MSQNQIAQTVQQNVAGLKQQIADQLWRIWGTSKCLITSAFVRTCIRCFLPYIKLVSISQFKKTSSVFFSSSSGLPRNISVQSLLKATECVMTNFWFHIACYIQLRYFSYSGLKSDLLKNLEKPMHTLKWTRVTFNTKSIHNNRIWLGDFSLFRPTCQQTSLTADILTCKTA